MNPKLEGKGLEMYQKGPQIYIYIYISLYANYKALVAKLIREFIRVKRDSSGGITDNNIN